jgi:ribosomal protein L32
MSLARAMTRRIKRSDTSSPPPARSQSVKKPSAQFDRSKISLPVALISTTNMLSYNAPDLVDVRHVSSSTVSTHSSGDDSDHSASTSRSRASTVNSRDTTLTDASSVDLSPTSPAPNHLSGYFSSTGKQVRKSVSTNSLQHVKEEIVAAAPVVPQRALSHSKRAHERLAAKRSLQNMNTRGSTGSLRNSREQRSSIDMFSAKIVEEAHPFGRELEQLNEIAEEFGGVMRDAETDADLTVMRSRNLAAFCAADYLAEIRPLFSSRFGFPQHAAPMAWI